MLFSRDNDYFYMSYFNVEYFLVSNSLNYIFHLHSSSFLPHFSYPALFLLGLVNHFCMYYLLALIYPMKLLNLYLIYLDMVLQLLQFLILLRLLTTPLSHHHCQYSNKAAGIHCHSLAGIKNIHARGM